MDYLVEGVLASAGWYSAKDVGQGGQHGPYERWNLLVHRLHAGYDLRCILLVDTVSFRFRLALGTHRTLSLSCPRRKLHHITSSRLVQDAVIGCFNEASMLCGHL